MNYQSGLKLFCVAIGAIIINFSLPYEAIAAQLIDKLTIFPINKTTVLAEVDSNAPVIIEITRHEGSPSIWLHEAYLAEAYKSPKGTLAAKAFLRPTAYEVWVDETEQGTWLIFKSTKPITLSVVYNPSLFHEEALKDLPLYPQWHYPTHPYSLTETTRVLEHIAAQLKANQPTKALALLEPLLPGNKHLPATAYQVASDLYLKEGRDLEALLILGEHALQHPNELGIAYGAMLYQLHQPEKAMQVLSDLAMMKNIQSSQQAQAHYMLGSLWIEQDNYTKALPHLNKASQLSPAEPNILLNLAITQEKTGNIAAAIETCKQLFEISATIDKAQIQSHLKRLMALPNKTPSPHKG